MFLSSLVEGFSVYCIHSMCSITIGRKVGEIIHNWTQHPLVKSEGCMRSRRQRSGCEGCRRESEDVRTDMRGKWKLRGGMESQPLWKGLGAEDQGHIRTFPPEQMKEKINVGSTKLGTNHLFSRWLTWANTEKCVYMCVGESIVDIWGNWKGMVYGY